MPVFAWREAIRRLAAEESSRGGPLAAARKPRGQSANTGEVDERKEARGGEGEGGGGGHVPVLRAPGVHELLHPVELGPMRRVEPEVEHHSTAERQAQQQRRPGCSAVQVWGVVAAPVLMSMYESTTKATAVGKAQIGVTANAVASTARITISSCWPATLICQRSRESVLSLRASCMYAEYNSATGMHKQNVRIAIS
eukprot:2748836-Pleurochrysis_carterae.AAC.1